MFVEKKKKKEKKLPSFWWESLQDDCPITLEPLSSLPCPPFALGNHYFDGAALACYIVSRGIFENPLTRQALTFQDCQRLDQHVLTYNQDKTLARCCQAYGLQQSMRVEVENEDRARLLRNEASAALCNLFVYGRQRRRNSTTQPQQQQRLPRTGFSLHAANPINLQDEMEGLQVIDDDEARVVQSEQQDWRQVQQAFPPLTSIPSATSGATTTTDAIPDERLLSTVRQTAERVQQQEERQQELLQEGRIRVLQEAKRRQEERQQLYKEARAAKRQEYHEQKVKELELEQARREIEEWRTRHWDQLLEQTRQEERQQQKVESAPIQDDAPTNESLDTTLQQEQLTKEQEEKERAARKAEKAAAKRKRAKERKRVKKALEREQARQQEAELLMERKRAECAKKCAACSGGILGPGFEKYNLQFCSTKCARAGPAPNGDKT